MQIHVNLHSIPTNSISKRRQIRAALNAGRSICLSVCLSNAWIVSKRKKNLFRFFYTIRNRNTIWRVCWEKDWLVGATLSTWNLGQPTLVGSKSPIFRVFNMWTICARKWWSHWRWIVSRNFLTDTVPTTDTAWNGDTDHMRMPKRRPFRLQYNLSTHEDRSTGILHFCLHDWRLMMMNEYCTVLYRIVLITYRSICFCLLQVKAYAVQFFTNGVLPIHVTVASSRKKQTRAAHGFFFICCTYAILLSVLSWWRLLAAAGTATVTTVVDTDKHLASKRVSAICGNAVTSWEIVNTTEKITMWPWWICLLFLFRMSLCAQLSDCIYACSLHHFDLQQFTATLPINIPYTSSNNSPNCNSDIFVLLFVLPCMQCDKLVMVTSRAAKLHCLTVNVTTLDQHSPFVTHSFFSID